MPNETAPGGERWTVDARLRFQAAAYPDKVLTTVDDVTYTYREFDEATERRAAGFAALDISAGTTVCQMLPSGIDYLVNWLALAKLGAVNAAINTEFRAGALVHMITVTESDTLVLHAQYVPVIEPVIGRLTRIRRILTVGDPAAFAGLTGRDRVLVPLETVASDAGVAPRTASIADPLMVLFTSGTTGLSKGVEISHGFALHFASELIYHWELTEDDVLYSAYPMFHAEATILTFLVGVHAGAASVIRPRFSVSKFWDDVRAHGVTYTTLMGAVMTFLWKQPERPDDRDNPLRVVCAAPTPDFAPQFERRFGVKCVEAYGATECCHPIHDDVHGEHRPGAVGRPCVHHEVRIGDDLDRECAIDEIGEILVRHHQPFSGMTRYVGNPEATIEATRNLWYHTGDLGSRDADGYIRFLGRKKDAIRRRGENISAYEIESAADEHEAVLESAVVGVPSEYTEDEVKAVLVLRPGAIGFEVRKFLDWLSDRVPRYAVPRYVEVVSELPKGPTGKVLKNEMRAQWRSAEVYDAEAGSHLPPEEAN
ncbi:AMP-binding protein [Amycolatopsis saalfeldensis]|nr:AMP-binding protein [Amycolatopsis saalfeldensis]